MIIRTTILLLLIIGVYGLSVASNHKNGSHALEKNKLHRILKNVGKREEVKKVLNIKSQFSNSTGKDEMAEWLAYMRERGPWLSPEETKAILVKNIAHLHPHPVDMDRLMTDTEYVRKTKKYVADNVIINIQGAYSDKQNLRHYQSTAFQMKQFPDMTAEICDSDQKLNRYQFNSYLLNHRRTFCPFHMSGYPNCPDQLETPCFADLVNFDYNKTTQNPLKMLRAHAQCTVTTSLGYNLTEQYDYMMEIDDDDNVFKIKHMKVGGGCTEFGKVNHNWTSLSTNNKNAYEALKTDGHPSFKSFADLITPPEFKLSDEDPKEIPEAWIYGMDPYADRRGLKIYVCRDRELGHDTLLLDYETAWFPTWYNRFRIMWHPKENDTDFVTLQVLDIKPDMILARITMRLQIGVQDSAKVREWNFKVTVNYNKHGDRKWYINRLEVQCPLFNYMHESLLAIRDVVTNNFLTVVQEGPKPVPWWSTIAFVEKFTLHGRVETYMNEMERTENMTAIKVKLFYYMKERDATLSWFKVDYDDIPLPAEHVSYFKLETVTRTIRYWFSKGKFLRQIWHFQIKWHDFYQFYYIEKLFIDFHALATTKELKNYNSVWRLIKLGK